MDQHDPPTVAPESRDLPAVWLRPVINGDAAYLAPRLRRYDARVPSDYVDNPDIPAMLQRAVDHTPRCVAVTDERGMFAIIGVGDDPTDPTVGLPWIAGTDRVKEHGVWLLRNIRQILRFLSSPAHRIHRGELPADETPFVRFVQWCGYDLADEITTPKGVTYIKFQGPPPCHG